MFKDTVLFEYLANDLSKKQRAEVEKWINSSVENLEHFNKLKSFYEGTGDSESENKLEPDWILLESQINKTTEVKADNKRKLTWWMTRAAAIIILALGTFFIYNLQRDIVIRGKSIEPLASILPDGSEVFLSHGSRLSYSRDFGSNVREVKILGEAYFTVTDDKEKPFIVDTGEAKIKVTGTSFLVSAKEKADDVEVAVNTGKVLFYNSETFSENSFKVDLGPGDIGTYYHSLNQLNKTHNKEHKNSIWKKDEL